MLREKSTNRASKMKLDTTTHHRTISVRSFYGTIDSYTLTDAGAKVRQTLLDNERFSIRRLTLLDVYNYLDKVIKDVR
jgi:hypothetical protein